ncbi:hypothetical protein [Alkalicoccobacillus porphyridii]|uniref:Uncharacterized protein n=1 Tax=Alkalicoccobacillus porphyridii TaxID=2597270 RepID=A0A554A213_9BACI|nr:hypothetical protein [Alkalicoccobacillus porphyridii]TSB47732.1 hypothetical protein FN960_04230 [Alkalicoccobacillus porphyridii]
MHTFNIPLLTFLALIIAFGVLYLQLPRSKRRVKIAFFFFLAISATPLIYILYDDFTHAYQDANIGLGLAYFYTWFMTGIVAIMAIIWFLLRKKKKHS